MSDRYRFIFGHRWRGPLYQRGPQTWRPEIKNWSRWWGKPWPATWYRSYLGRRLRLLCCSGLSWLSIAGLLPPGPCTWSRRCSCPRTRAFAGRLYWWALGFSKAPGCGRRWGHRRWQFERAGLYRKESTRDVLHLRDAEEDGNKSVLLAGFFQVEFGLL